VVHRGLGAGGVGAVSIGAQWWMARADFNSAANMMAKVNNNALENTDLERGRNGRGHGHLRSGVERVGTSLRWWRRGRCGRGSWRTFRGVAGAEERRAGDSDHGHQFGIQRGLDSASTAVGTRPARAPWRGRPVDAGGDAGGGDGSGGYELDGVDHGFVVTISGMRGTATTRRWMTTG